MTMTCTPSLHGAWVLTLLLATMLPAMAAETQFVVMNLHPHEVTDAVFEDIGRLDPGGAEAGRRVGVAAIFSYLHQPKEGLEASLREFLRLSEAHDMPVVVQLDGEQWWGNRPDLWNWWDPAQAGYDPENRSNVEWAGWDPESAIRIAWRNWGRQIRVLPPPNLMSSAYRSACHDEMRYLVPIVLDWWRALPTGRQDLLIGIKVGWESSTGVNAFYYPNGNGLADLPEEDDPTTGFVSGDVPSRGVAATGYAGVKTAGLADSGELREADLAEVIRRHLDDLCGLAAELGVPRERLFTHCAGWKAGELLYDAAVNAHSCPGWSFYQYGRNPQDDPGAMRALAASDAPFWAAVEWLPLGAASGADWHRAVDTFFSSPQCRYVCVYNWNGIYENAEILDGLSASLGGPLDANGPARD